MSNYFDLGCVNPVLVVNPSLTSAFLKSDCFFIDGKKRSITSDMKFRVLDHDASPSSVMKLPFVRSLRDDFYNKLSDANKLDCFHRLENFLDDSFLLNSETGESFPIWTYVVCGHCGACNSSKVSSIIQRCEMCIQETMLPAWFVTLTYNDHHLPPNGNVSRRDLQLFQKKLKRSLSCEGIDSTKVKFVYSSEYGKLGRPHYHLIIFGLPKFFPDHPNDSDAYYDFKINHFIRFSWREAQRVEHGKFMSFSRYCSDYPLYTDLPSDYDPFSKGFVQCSQLNSSAAISYSLKYAFKTFYDSSSSVNDSSLDVSNGRDPGFIGVSTRMGVDYVTNHFDEFFSQKDNTFKFYSFLDNNFKEVHLSSYYLSKLFPSECDLVPKELRRSYVDVVYLSQVLQHPSFPKNYRVYGSVISQLARDHFPFLEFFENFRIPDETAKLYSSFNHFSDFFQCFIDRSNVLFSFWTFDFTSILDKLKKRNEFFSRFPKREWWKVCESSRKFRKDMLINISKSTLL